MVGVSVAVGAGKVLVTVLTLKDVALVGTRRPTNCFFGRFAPKGILLGGGRFTGKGFGCSYVGGRVRFLGRSASVIVRGLRSVSAMIVSVRHFVPFRKRFVRIVASRRAALFVS